MSRVGKKPIPIPSDVRVDIDGPNVVVAGSRGTLARTFHPDISVLRDGDVLRVERPSDERDHRALHGLTGALLANMVTGVSEGFRRSLELVGAGYRVQQTGDGIVLQVGYSHTVEMARRCRALSWWWRATTAYTWTEWTSRRWVRWRRASGGSAAPTPIRARAFDTPARGCASSRARPRVEGHSHGSGEELEKHAGGPPPKDQAEAGGHGSAGRASLCSAA